ncbi:hypothetical protein ACQPYK_28740 [Streptosporangium sp. CA-135522]
MAVLKSMLSARCFYARLMKALPQVGPAHDLDDATARLTVDR